MSKVLTDMWRGHLCPIQYSGDSNPELRRINTAAARHAGYMHSALFGSL